MIGALRRRKAVARAALKAFVGGFLLLPALHQYDHRDDHTHGPRGLSVEAHAHPHPHPGISVTVAAERTALQAPRPAHDGGESLAHFGLATTPVAVQMAPAAFLFTIRNAAFRAASDPPAQFLRTARQPRAPPVS